PLDGVGETALVPGTAGQHLGVVLFEDAVQLLAGALNVPGHLVGVEQEHTYVNGGGHNYSFSFLPESALNSFMQSSMPRVAQTRTACKARLRASSISGRSDGRKRAST